MDFNSKSVDATPEILKRKLGGELFVPVTIKSTEFTSATVVKAGNPIDADGEVANDGTAVGILLNDVEKANPNGSLIKAFAVVNETVAEAHASISYTSTMKAALPNIIFE